jgi:hypothetical protein
VPNIVKITVENAEELLNAGAYDTGALARLQWSATEAGAFVDVSGTGSTPTLPLVSGTRIYTGYDPNGTSSTWYRSRFENAGATRLSDWTTVFQVGDEQAGLICSLYDVKQRLAIAPSDTSEDENILEFIRQATAEIQNYCSRRFVRTPLNGTSTFLYDVIRAGRELSVPAGIAAATQLEVATSSQPETGGVYTIVPSTDWFLRPTAAERDYLWPATRIVLSDVGSAPYFYPGFNVVRLTGAEGWSAIPPDVQGVGQGMVIRRFMAKGSADTAVVGPTGAMTVLRVMSPSERAILDRYAVLVAA